MPTDFEALQGAWSAYDQGAIGVLESLIESWDELAAGFQALGLPADPVAILSAVLDDLRQRPLGTLKDWTP